MFRYGPGGFHHGPGVFGWLLFALLVALVLLGVIALVRIWSNAKGGPAQPKGGPSQSAGIDPALAELRLRYARGEISWEECALRAANLGYALPPGLIPTGSPQAPPAQPPASEP